VNHKKISLNQLEQYLSKAAWILKGPVDASDFKVYIFSLLFFKRISDVYGEEYRIALKTKICLLGLMRILRSITNG
jgi:type I restriction enzyme M protein